MSCKVIGCKFYVLRCAMGGDLQLRTYNLLAPLDSLMIKFKESLHFLAPTRRPSSNSKAAKAACSP